MWRNYLTVGLRALAKNKTYAFINIFGLAHRPGRLPDDPALRPLRAELRQMAAQRGEHLPVPEPLPGHADRRGGASADDLLRRRHRAREGFPAGRAGSSTRSSTGAGRASATARRCAIEDVLLVDGKLFFDVLQFPLRPGRSRQRARQARIGGAHGERGEAAVRHATDVVGQTLTMI